MAGNPLISQGSLNRLIASVTWPAFPRLNVTAPFLGKEGIRLALEGDTTLFINTLTGAVTSPEPYQVISLTMHLIKTQNLAALYKAQMELTALLGDGNVKPDTRTLPPYQLQNCAIQSVRELNFSGDDAGFAVTIRGYYVVNSEMWNLL